MTVLCVIRLRSLVDVCRCFGGACCLHLQGDISTSKVTHQRKLCGIIAFSRRILSLAPEPEKMKLALVIASLIAALGFAPSARAYVPYVLKHKGLEPWGHDVVVMPIKEKTLQGEDVEISLPEEDNNYLLTPVIVAVRQIT